MHGTIESHSRPDTHNNRVRISWATGRVRRTSGSFKAAGPNFHSVSPAQVTPKHTVRRDRMRLTGKQIRPRRKMAPLTVTSSTHAVLTSIGVAEHVIKRIVTVASEHVDHSACRDRIAQLIEKRFRDCRDRVPVKTCKASHPQLIQSRNVKAVKVRNGETTRDRSPTAAVYGR